jgi:hypothetical protein
MSSSSVAERASALRAEIEELVRGGDVAAVDDRTIQDLLTTAVRLYAARVDQGGALPAVGRDAITATDAMIASSGLLRAVNIAPFELGLWQAWST